VINFRFHLVSLVAIFLALGVGVAMGASFIDRATVETMRDRLDQLETNYRERGNEIDALRDQLDEVDGGTAELVAQDSLVIDGRLEGRDVVVLAAAGLEPAAVDPAWDVLQAAGANRTGAVLLQPTVDLEDAEVLAQVRQLLGLQTATPSLVRGRLLDRLAESLAVLTAPAPVRGVPDAAPEQGDEAPVESPGTAQPPPSPNGVDATSPETVPPPSPAPTAPTARPLGPTPTPEEVENAQRYLEALAEVGVISIEVGESNGEGFSAVAEVSYVVLLDDGAPEASAESLDRVVRNVAELAPATVTVGPAARPRAPGTLDGPEREPSSTALTALREDEEAAARLSTVDHLEEVLGRLALVLAIEEQLAGGVGHYGTGAGATATVPQSTQ
jgi:hypothetical protein